MGENARCRGVRCGLRVIGLPYYLGISRIPDGHPDGSCRVDARKAMHESSGDNTSGVHVRPSQQALGAFQRNSIHNSVHYRTTAVSYMYSASGIIYRSYSANQPRGHHRSHPGTSSDAQPARLSPRSS
jgi:hypothetical protein